MKQCSRCKEKKDLSLFSKDTARKDGHNHRCKACHSDVGKEWKQRADPQKLKENQYKAHIKHKYGVSIEWVEERLAAHDYKCKVCETEMKLHTNTVAIDHCHETGEVRDVVCKKCNLAMGQFRDDPKLIEKAIDYLIEMKEKT